MNHVNGAHAVAKQARQSGGIAQRLLVLLMPLGLLVSPTGGDAFALELEAETELQGGGAARVVTGDLAPLYFDFIQISETPVGYSTWRVEFGTQLTGGLDGTTEDHEFSVLKPDGSGEINGVGTFSGELDGREGGFIFESVGDQNADGTFTTTFKVKRQTAWGELAGLRGTGTVTATNQCGATPDTCTTVVTYRFEYRLPRPPKGQISEQVSGLGEPVASHPRSILFAP